MSVKWYEPLNFSEWLKRVFSLANLSLLIIIALFIYSEFEYNWGEKIIGIYLASTNEQRPEKGTIWESGKQAFKAHKDLYNIISKNEDIRETAGKALSFTELLSGIKAEEWLTLEKKQIKSLYQSLEKSLAFKLINPAKLIWLLNNGRVERIFCKGTEDGARIFFVDADNRVIQEIEIRKKEISAPENKEQRKYSNLNQIPGLKERIFPAKIFFEALLELPDDIIPDLISNPELLLNQDGTITRVGIDNEAVSGYITIGFEFSTFESSQIVFIKGREWAVWQLLLKIQETENKKQGNSTHISYPVSGLEGQVSGLEGKKQEQEKGQER